MDLTANNSYHRNNYRGRDEHGTYQSRSTNSNTWGFLRLRHCRRSRFIVGAFWIACYMTLFFGYIKLLILPGYGKLPVDISSVMVNRDESILSLQESDKLYWNPEGYERVKALNELVELQRLGQINEETRKRLDKKRIETEASTQLNSTNIDSTNNHEEHTDTTLTFSSRPIFIVVTLCVIIRICVHLGLLRIDSGNIFEIDANGSFIIRNAATRSRFQRQRRQQLSAVVDRLNAERAANGERPISMESLRLVLSNRDFNPNDYDSLWRFQDDNGPSAFSFLNYVGATEAEISRCPQRTIKSQHDELLLTKQTELSNTKNSPSSQGTTCAICLEQFQIGDSVRTIPCFHTFHTSCIDPWLRNKAICPICKHHAIP